MSQNQTRTSHSIDKALLAFVFDACRPFKLCLSYMLIYILIRAINSSLSPYLLKLIIDRVEDPVPANLWHSIGILASIYFGIIAVYPFLTAINQYLIKVVMAPQMKRNLFNLSFDTILQQSYAYYQNNFAGTLSSKVNDLIACIPDIVQLLVRIVFWRGFAVLAAVFTLWYIHHLFGLIILIWAIIHLIFTFVTMSYLSELSDKRSVNASTLYGKLVDSISGILSVRLFSREAEESHILDLSVKDTVTADKNQQWGFLKVWFYYDYLYVVAQGISLYLLFKGRSEGWVTIGDFVAVTSINLVIADILAQLTNDISSLTDFWGRAKQAFRTLDVIPAIQDIKGAKPLVVTQGCIVYDNVKFNYEGSPTLFDKKSVVIVPGQKVGLVGYSGGGKTTFVNLLLRLFEVIDGRILIDGQDIKDVTQESLRNAIAMIPQDPALFHRSLMDNIRYGRLGATDKEVIEAAKSANAHAFITALPNGYDTLVGERGIKLSGGQRQRVSIARAILKNAPILILDEATSQLDTITESEIQDALWKLMQSKTTIVIAHRLSTLLHMERLLVIDNGEIVEDGTHQDLLTQAGLYKELWEAQVLKRYEQRAGYIKSHKD